MFETVLNVLVEDVLPAILGVANKSRTALREVLDLYHNNNSSKDEALAVRNHRVEILFQEMVDCWYSGVAFRRCPISVKQTVTIEAVEGLCDKSTTGEVTPKRFTISAGHSDQQQHQSHSYPV